MYKQIKLMIVIICIISSRLRRFLSKQQGIILADIVLKLIFFEINVGLITRFDKDWPIINIASFMVPDLFMINLLSIQQNVLPPVKKFPLVNVGPEGAKDLFGWEGSKRFYDAAGASKQLDSQKPSIATEGAVEFVAKEFEES
jgi:hypothetical protein